jgi:hypothetical protein
MKLEIESTSEIVAIESIPCRKWNVTSINGRPPESEAHIYTRLLMLPKTLMIEDEHIMSLNGPHPPTQTTLASPAPELDDTICDDDDIENWSVSA